MIDEGRIVQRGTPAHLATAPASAFVADLTGATVLRGTARPGPGGLTLVALDGGGEVRAPTSQPARWRPASTPGRSRSSPPGRPPTARPNRLEASVETVTILGNRARVGLTTPQPLTAELTGEAVHVLALEPGTPVLATWKATATRISPR